MTPCYSKMQQKGAVRAILHLLKQWGYFTFEQELTSLVWPAKLQPSPSTEERRTVQLKHMLSLLKYPHNMVGIIQYAKNVSTTDSEN